jgi:hypothetical protein
MFADAEDVEPDTIGEFDLRDQIGESLVDAGRFARAGIAPCFDECVSDELHGRLENRRPHSRRADAMIACAKKEIELQ